MQTFENLPSITGLAYRSVYAGYRRTHWRVTSVAEVQSHLHP
jgi:hypothetical protein